MTSGPGTAARRLPSMPRMKSSFLVTAPLLAAATLGSGLRHQRRLAGADRPRREALQGDRHRGPAPDDVRRLDRDTGVGQARRRHRRREARGDARSRRRPGDQELAGRQPHRARGEAAAGRIVQRVRLPPDGQRPAHRVGAARRERRRAQRRRDDHDRARQRPARAADRRRQHPRIGRRRRAHPRHRRRVGHGRGRAAGGSPSIPATAA